MKDASLDEVSPIRLRLGNTQLHQFETPSKPVASDTSTRSDWTFLLRLSPGGSHCGFFILLSSIKKWGDQSHSRRYEINSAICHYGDSAADRFNISSEIKTKIVLVKEENPSFHKWSSFWSSKMKAFFWGNGWCRDKNMNFVKIRSVISYLISQWHTQRWHSHKHWRRRKEAIYYYDPYTYPFMHSSRSFEQNDSYGKYTATIPRLQ